MAQGDPSPPDTLGEADPVQSALQAISNSLLRRGYLTTEWWTTILGGALSAVLALLHIKASSATHVVAVVVPALLAALYAVTRTVHKAALASVLDEVFPQAVAGAQRSATGGQGTQNASLPSARATPINQTSPGLVFEGIPPVEEANG